MQDKPKMLAIVKSFKHQPPLFMDVQLEPPLVMDVQLEELPAFLRFPTVAKMAFGTCIFTVTGNIQLFQHFSISSYFSKIFIS